MIIRRYLISETLKTQIAILFVLFMIFFSQKLIRILSNAVEGDIPSSLVMPLLMLGISNMADLILPLSLYLGIIITFTRLYSESEMVAMYACGVKKLATYQVVIFLAIITSLFSIANSVWFGPWSSIQEKHLVEDAKVNPSLVGLLASGQFQHTPKGDSVIYIGDAEKSKVKDVFIAQINPRNGQRPAVILADKGKIANDDQGNQVIILENANRYEGSVYLKDYRIANFKDYQAVIKTKDTTMSDDEIKRHVDQLSFSQLRSVKTPEAKAEYYWRVSLILSVPLMAFLVLPLSVANPRQGRMVQILPALLIYLVYYLIESSVKANASKGRLDPTFWFNVVNGSYLLLAILFNIWDTLPIRKLRYRFNHRRLMNV